MRNLDHAGGHNCLPTSTARSGEFALAAGFQRIDDDPRPISEIPEDELLGGSGR
jgi:hypothetical protein